MGGIDGTVIDFQAKNGVLYSLSNVANSPGVYISDGDSVWAPMVSGMIPNSQEANTMYTDNNDCVYIGTLWNSNYTAGGNVYKICVGSSTFNLIGGGAPHPQEVNAIGSIIVDEALNTIYAADDCSFGGCVDMVWNDIPANIYSAPLNGTWSQLGSALPSSNGFKVILQYDRVDNKLIACLGATTRCYINTAGSWVGLPTAPSNFIASSNAFAIDSVTHTLYASTADKMVYKLENYTGSWQQVGTTSPDGSLINAISLSRGKLYSVTNLGVVYKFNSALNQWGNTGFGFLGMPFLFLSVN